MLNNEPVCALLDSGSSISAIDHKWFQERQTICRWGNVSKDEDMYQTVDKTNLQVKGMCQMKVSVGGFTWKWTMRIIENLATECILGADFMAKTGLVLEWSEQQFYFRFKPKVRLQFAKIQQSQILGSACGVQDMNYDDVKECFSLDEQLCHLDEFLKTKIKEVCYEFPDVLTEELGTTDLVEYRVELSDQIPVKKAPYRLSPPKMKELREHVDKMLRQGVIRPSKSPYAAPMFLVPKANGGSRPVVDYRELNKKVVLRSIPMPDLHSCFGWFKGAKIFTTLDLNQAYNQIPLHESSKHVTAVITDWNLFEFNRVPFGLATGAAVLSQLMDAVLSDIKYKFVFHYLDDLVIYSDSVHEHIQHLREVFSRLRKAGLTVNPRKVVFACSNISFLGHMVSGEGISIDPERVRAVEEYPRPRNVKEVARFVGVTNFFRKFISGFAEKAAPLNALRKKGAKFLWGPSQEGAFVALKKALISAPVLALPDFNEEFILQTDASGHGVGAVLLQEQDGAKKVIAYASRGLNELEKRYSVYELEALAVLFGMEKFRYYLEHRKFILETDNQALSWVLGKPRKSGRIARWATRILTFKFDVNHIKGSENVVADGLSRMFGEDDGEQETECNQPEDESVPVVASILTQIPQLFKDIREFQQADEHLRAISEKLRAGEVAKPYQLSNGVLCCKPRGKSGLRVVVPKELTALLFKYYHDSPVGGHLGVYKTREKIRENFIWPRMDHDIRTAVRNCEICAKSKPAQNSKIGLLASKVVDKPFERMYVDFVGPLPRSKAGNKYILVCVDAFTRFVWLLPTRGATTQLVIDKLQGIFGTFGPPQTIVTDNASTFTSQRFKQFQLGMGIQHVTTTPYYPKPSYAERLNRNLKSALIAYHSGDHSGWDRSLPWLSMAFNTARHESHQSTPASLLLGYRIASPLSNLWSIDDLLPENKGVHQVVEQWRKARKNIRAAHKREAMRYNEGRRPNQYRVGDHVFLRNFQAISKAEQGISKKLLPRFRGPFEIIRFLTPVTVQLKELGTGKINRAHVTQLKPGPRPELRSGFRQAAE